MNLVENKLQFLHLTNHSFRIHHLKIKVAAHDILLGTRVLGFVFLIQRFPQLFSRILRAIDVVEGVR